MQNTRKNVKSDSISMQKSRRMLGPTQCNLHSDLAFGKIELNFIKCDRGRGRGRKCCAKYENYLTLQLKSLLKWVQIFVFQMKWMNKCAADWQKFCCQHGCGPWMWSFLFASRSLPTHILMKLFLPLYHASVADKGQCDRLCCMQQGVLERRLACANPREAARYPVTK